MRALPDDRPAPRAGRPRQAIRRRRRWLRLRVRRVLLPLLVLATCAGLGAWVALTADEHAGAALLLHAEPALLVLAVWGIAAARWSRSPGLALALSVGTVLATAAVRAPRAPAPFEAAPPSWTAPVARCAAALRSPVDTVRLLQWTLDGSEEDEEVLGVVADTHANVIVLQGAPTPPLVRAVVDQVGGESRLHGSPGAATAVVAQGGFHPCGDGLEWSEAMDSAEGFTLAFVGVPPSTVFPLLVARFPHPAYGGDWAGRMRASTARVFDALAGMQGASTVVVADANAPSTYRNLDGQMAALGLGSASVPPSWPARLGPIPLLPLHPYSRVWTGPAWRVAAADTPAANAGSRAPVLTVLTGPDAPEDRAPAAPQRGPLEEPTLEPREPAAE